MKFKVRPSSILFACNLNAVRSPLGEGLMRLIYGQEIFVDSCGLKPAERFDPFAVGVLDEVGAQVAGPAPKRFEDLADSSFDLVISLTPEAHHRALDYARGRAMENLYWPTLDPTQVSGGREAIVSAYRQARDGLRARIIAQFGEPLSPGG
jgi:protein-tyrosine-phosphatase